LNKKWKTETELPGDELARRQPSSGAAPVNGTGAAANGRKQNGNARRALRLSCEPSTRSPTGKVWTLSRYFRRDSSLKGRLSFPSARPARSSTSSRVWARRHVQSGGRAELAPRPQRAGRARLASLLTGPRRPSAACLLRPSIRPG